MKAKSLWVIVVTLLSFSLNAQQGTIRGKLLHIATGDVPILNLLRVHDTSLVKTTVAEQDGIFSFEMLQHGEYLIAIREPNYEPYQSERISLSGNDTIIMLPDIVLKLLAKAKHYRPDNPALRIRRREE